MQRRMHKVIQVWKYYLGQWSDILQTRVEFWVLFSLCIFQYSCSVGKKRGNNRVVSIPSWMICETATTRIILPSAFSIQFHLFLWILLRFFFLFYPIHCSIHYVSGRACLDYRTALITFHTLDFCSLVI